MPFKDIDNAFQKELLEVIKRHGKLEFKTFTFQYLNYEITLSLEPMRNKMEEKKYSRQINEENTENSFGSFSEEQPDINPIKKDYGPKLIPQKLLPKENESNLDSELKNKSNSIQKHTNDLKFKNDLDNDETDNKKCKKKKEISLGKIKEVNENNDRKPKGLLNLGLNCYMNSLLQCLYYIKELREFFIEEKDKFKEDQKICKAFAEIMNGLKNDVKDYFEPREFKRIMGEANSLFLGCKAADVKDLFFNLIDIFLSELSNDNDNDNKSIYSIVSFSLKKNIFEQNLKDIDQDNIINKLFIGYYETIYYCSQKRTNIYSFQADSFIIFDLGKIQTYFGTDKLSIESCFKYYYREQENSSFYCKKCRKTHNGKANEKIYRPPKILVLILDRGHGKTFKGEVEIKIELDLKNLIDEEKYDYSSLYELICVSTHEGESSSNGHYTARCLADNNKYYYFSDKDVKEINKDNLFKNEPYLLFYKQIEINEKNKETKQNEYENKNELEPKDNEKNNEINKKYNKKNIGIGRKDKKRIICSDPKHKENLILNEIRNNNKNREKIKKEEYQNLNNKKEENIYNGHKGFLNNNNKNILAYKENTYKKNGFKNSNLNNSYNSNNKREKKDIESIKYRFKNNEVHNTFKQFLEYSNSNYKIDYFNPSVGNFFSWKLTIFGPKNSVYKDWEFIFKLDLSKPFQKLIANMVKIQNSNYYPLNFSVPIYLDKNYNANQNLYENFKDFFDFIYNLFDNPDNESNNSNNYKQMQKIYEKINNIKKYK